MGDYNAGYGSDQADRELEAEKKEISQAVSSQC